MSHSRSMASFTINRPRRPDARQVAVIDRSRKSAHDRVDPAAEQVWEALRALYLVGLMEDLPAITPYERERYLPIL